MSSRKKRKGKRRIERKGMSSREKKEKEREGKQDSAKTVIYRLIRRKNSFYLQSWLLLKIQNSNFTFFIRVG